jgi:hypothetical protein
LEGTTSSSEHIFCGSAALVRRDHRGSNIVPSDGYWVFAHARGNVCFMYSLLSSLMIG